MACLKKNKPQVAEVVESSNNIKYEGGEEMSVKAKVGLKAPDFETTAYFNGDFREFKLSNYLGKWVMLCFYPADFTFV